MINIAKKPELVKIYYSITKSQKRKLVQLAKREGHKYASETLRNILQEYFKK